jgi:regulation of enolase protein 1 (concanavalin A-like superfamily)
MNLHSLPGSGPDLSGSGPRLPEPGIRFDWTVPPQDWSLADGTLTATAAGGTDVFVSPFGGEAREDAARALLAAPGGDWQFLARLRVGFRDAWDAGALLVWSDEKHWAKVNFEQSTDGVPTVFSVVTQGVSDDAVGWSVDVPYLWLRVSHLDGAYAFHASEDGEVWRLVRQFALEAPAPVRPGLLVQSPVGQGCVVEFDRIALTPTRLAHLFDGR